MDKTINPVTKTYDGTVIDTLQNAVYLRLTTPRGKWWADKEFGSLLHLIHREKDLPRVGLLAQQYAEEALEPIVKSKRAKSITVTPHQPHNGKLLLEIAVIDLTGKKHPFYYHVKVI